MSANDIKASLMAMGMVEAMNGKDSYSMPLSKPKKKCKGERYESPYANKKDRKKIKG